MSNPDSVGASSPASFADGGGPRLQRIVARTAEIGGGVSVSRLLPTLQRRMVGAWCFLDHAGPAGFEPGAGMRVGPHPHIGLQTFTWMIEGEVLHRDSLGHVQVIRPGQVNLMTAGRGISHTEESLPGERRLHAAQLWIALPAAECDCAPAFDHYPDLPVWDEQGCRFTLLAGRWGGREAPARLYSPLVGIDLHAPAES
ncbi:MAG: pirin family protein, partial [Proteobacteria bacterium]|nr:pirin family protein [Pseudomonadota bacterium]